MTMGIKLFIALLIALLLCATSYIDACGPGRGGGRRRMMRKYKPLVQRQYIPSVSEHTLGASGKPEGAIRRTDKRFKELVQNWNPDIEFRDDEKTGADRIMSQRLKEKLSTLAISVMNQWPNVKLRVIEGWDEDGMHQVDSLHYEGRAVDITTSDRDRSKYGMLARLAVEAGFDWVHYESRSHVHCSVKSERSDAIRNNGCFDAKSIVQTPEGTTEMSKLQINQLVLTMDSKTGKLQYSPAIMWLDLDESGEDLFVELKTKSNRTIRLTSSHLIYFAEEDNGTPQQQATSFTTYARNLVVGQYLLVNPDNNLNDDENYKYEASFGGGANLIQFVGHNKKNARYDLVVDSSQEQQTLKHIKFDQIVSVNYTIRAGVYAPLTREGNIVVNSIVASCYAVISDHDLAHLSFAPVRWYSYLQEWIFGFFAKSHITRQARVHWYPSLLYRIGRLILPTRYLY